MLWSFASLDYHHPALVSVLLSVEGWPEMNVSEFMDDQ